MHYTESSMKKFILIILALYLVGCQSSSPQVKPFYSSNIVEIKADELSNYWVLNTSKVQLVKRRPTWLPKGQGEWTVLTVIDSNGNVIEKTLVSSKPKGFMTQSKVDDMPITTFEPAPSNQNRVPVKFYSKAKIGQIN